MPSGMENILVTGGAGFIGSYIVDLLIEEGYNVIIFDNLEEQVHGSSQKPPKYLNSLFRWFSEVNK